jgi:hypothetical protein
MRIAILPKPIATLIMRAAVLPKGIAILIIQIAILPKRFATLIIRIAILPKGVGACFLPILAGFMLILRQKIDKMAVFCLLIRHSISARFYKLWVE